MIFLVFAILELIVTIIFAIFTFKVPSAITIISLIVMALNCILFFSLYGMHKDIQRHEENIFILQKSLNECRKKLGLTLLEKEYDDEKETTQDKEEFVGENQARAGECPACFHKITPDDMECPNCGFSLFNPIEEYESVVQDPEENYVTAEKIEDFTQAQENECPACFHKITPNDTECTYCGYKLK